MKASFKIPVLFLLIALVMGCEKNYEPIEVSAQDYHDAVDMVTAIQVHDIFSPPVSSRIYAYSNIAAYEAMITGDSSYRSLAG